MTVGGSETGCAEIEKTPLNGLIQHSFALRIDREHLPFAIGANWDRVSERFSLPPDGGPGFRAKPVSYLVGGAELHRVGAHSPLMRSDRTSVRALGVGALGKSPGVAPDCGAFPEALAWACRCAESAEDCETHDEPRLIFADRGRDLRGSSRNDFLIENPRDELPEQKISQLLLELVAHMRSRLFGLALANRFVNVMLPHATLTPSRGGAEQWLLQPLVTLIRDAHDHRGFRGMFTLSTFLVPVDGSVVGFAARQMLREELRSMVNPGWGLAASPVRARTPSFELRGPLWAYLSRLASPDIDGLLNLPPGVDPDQRLTLRQWVETIAYGTALRVARGSVGKATAETKRRIGNDVVTALGSSRASSLVVVDENLTVDDVRAPIKGRKPPPGVLGSLMKDLAGDTRPPSWTLNEHHKYRLDRPLADGTGYTVGVLPHSRCLIVASARDAQCGRFESAFMQAGSFAYMTLGAATAIGTLRAIDRDLEKLSGENPGEIAAIDSEIATDLNEIYDLDITREAYRNLYRRLRKRLGIASDYATLQDKMSALYRATSTNHELKSQKQLAWLTAAIVALSLLILIGTVVLAAKPDGGGGGEGGSGGHARLIACSAAPADGARRHCPSQY